MHQESAYLIDQYKEANRKQTRGFRRKSLFSNEIDAVLGCHGIVTLSHVSVAGTTSTHLSSSPTSFETLDSSVVSDDQSGKENWG